MIIHELVKITTKPRLIIAFSLMFLQNAHFLTYDSYHSVRRDLNLLYGLACNGPDFFPGWHCLPFAILIFAGPLIDIIGKANMVGDRLRSYGNYFCDRLRSCDRDRRRSQNFRTMFFLKAGFHMIADDRRPYCDLRSAIILFREISRFTLIRLASAFQ